MNAFHASEARFAERLQQCIVDHESLLCVGLDPNPEMLPIRDRVLEPSEITDRLRDWLAFIISDTADLVCAYRLTLGFYVALGAPGLELLQHTIAAIPAKIPIILDAKQSDLNSSTQLAQTAFEQWKVDAMTLNAYAGQDQVAPFLVHSGKAVFVLCCTANSSADKLQSYPTPESPFYLQMVKEAKTWGTPEQLGLEVGTLSIERLGHIRGIAPERLILLRSIWQEGIDLREMLAAGLNEYGEGLLIPVPQDWLSHDRPSLAINSLREQVNQARAERVRDRSTCSVWLPDVCTLTPHPHLDLILQLYDIGCVLFGEYSQASGAKFPYYVDLRKIISTPQIFHQILTAYADILQDLSFDRIAGIPYGSLPTATGLALRLNYPMIFPRKEVKAHGTRRVIEGNFEPGETIVVVDDILISGNSAIEGAAKIKSVGLAVQDIVVFLDHERGVKDRLREQGYRAHSVLTMSEVTETLYQAGRIDQVQYEALAEP